MLGKKIKIYMFVSIILIALFAIIFPDQGVWAAAQAAKTSNCEKTLVWLSTLAKLLSWIWIIPAILAGKLMTNDFVFGGVFHLDIYLWKVWNIMKNFANYLIGFVFVYMVIKTFFQGESKSKLTSVLPKILVSAILVQASWFIMGVLVDMSSIMTAAVGSFVSQFISNSEYKGYLENMKGRIPNELQVSVTNDPQGVITTAKGASTIGIEKLLPNYDSVSGPLLFFGYSVLRLQDFSFANDNQNSCGVMTFSELFKYIVIMLFTIPIILLVIVNVIRMIYIWFWTILSPFIVVYNVLKGEIKSKAMESVGNRISFGSIIGLIFVPVSVVAAMSFSMILIMGVDSMMLQGNTKSSQKVDLNGATYEQKSNDEGTLTIPLEGVENPPSINIKGNIFKEMKDVGGGLIGYIILTTMTIMLVWGVLKVSFESSKLTKNLTDGAFKFFGSMAKAVPILPGGVGIAAMGQALNKSTVHSNVFGKRDSARAEQFMKDSGLDKLNNFAGDISITEENEIKSALSGMKTNPVGESKEFFTKLSSIANNKEQGLRINTSPKFKQALLDWARIPEIQRKLESTYGINKDIIKDDAKLLSNQTFANIVINMMNSPGNQFESDRANVPQPNHLSGTKFGGKK